jgi:hypothetical protein
VHMLIEDFKRAVAQLEVGDELKLEDLCEDWNSGRTREHVEQLYLQIDELEGKLEAANNRCASLSKEFAREYAHSRALKQELLGIFEGFVQHMIEYERKKFYELVAEVERRTTDVCLIDRPTGPVKESQCA